MGHQLSSEVGPADADPEVKGDWNISWLGLDDETEDCEGDDEDREAEGYLMMFDPTTAFRRNALDSLSESTYFSRHELLTLHKAFQRECPEGELTPAKFMSFYSNFFPGRGEAYAGLVFNQFDRDRKGKITFEDFMASLSVSCRGTLDEKLAWTFSLYDQDADGFMSKEDLLVVMEAVFEMLGDKVPFPETTPQARCNILYKCFKVRDKKRGVALKDFVKACKKDVNIKNGMNMFQGAI